MSTTATRSSPLAPRARPPSAAAIVITNNNIVLRRMIPTPLLELERSTERELDEARPVVLLRVERFGQLHPQGAERRQPAYARARCIARVVQARVPVRIAVGVAGVEEHHALQPDRLDEREDDLVVEDDLLAAADRIGGDLLPEPVEGGFPRPHRPGLEAANRIDAAGKVALEQRQRFAVEPRAAPPPSDVGAERVREVAERLGVQEGVVEALLGFRLDELFATEAGELHRQVLERAGGRVEGVIQGVAADRRRDAADEIRPLFFTDRSARVVVEV